MSLTTFIKEGIFNFKLKLANGDMFTIPMREDGYIYATALCKASGKRLNNYIRAKETTDVIEQLSIDASIQKDKLFEIYKGGI